MRPKVPHQGPQVPLAPAPRAPRTVLTWPVIPASRCHVRMPDITGQSHLRPVVRPGPERRTVRDMLSRVDARGGGQAVPASSLSGGNQQKLLFARSLLSDPTVLIADEPTRGVDVGAKRAIYELLTTLTADGLGILLISSDVEEI